ncbi:MAG: pirin family protein [Thioalkalispiraceae bacterium]|jgi:redox-sensitive bicupin YhaK (pirin superfamily)
MTIRTAERIIQTTEVTEGAGVTVHRSIGTPAIRNLDPFLLLDHFGSDDPDAYIAGFPDHPHRGFNTFTYMLDGHMLHQDSMGNRGDLISGGAQWMKAGSGVIHSEMPQQTEGLMQGFQLWINLPAEAKMSEPGYQEYSASAFPVVSDEEANVKVLLGKYKGTTGPIEDPYTAVSYFDVELTANATFRHEFDSGHTGFIYLFEGEAAIENDNIPVHSFVVLSRGDEVRIKAGDNGARFILVTGKPIGEPIAQYGPFVMNTQQEIHQAMADYRDGILVQEKASMVGH